MVCGSLATSCVSTPSIAWYYKKCMRPLSYYRDTYCFELPKERVTRAVQWVLKRYRYTLTRNNAATGRFATKPVILPHYSCNRKFTYAVGLEVTVEESRGALSLRKFPAWLEKNKLPPTPRAPERSQFKSFQAYDKALQAYNQKLVDRVTLVNRYVELMHKWQGCNVRKSKVRTVVTVRARVTGYPLDRWGNLNTKKPRKVRSDNTMEYATLREVGKRLGKQRFMPRILR